MSKLLRLFAAVLAAASFSILVTASAVALLGNVKIGGFKVPCAVACGGDRGIVNLNFAGDTVNSLFLGPSIDNFENSTNRSVDRATGQLTNILTGQRKALLDDLAKLTAAERGKLVSQLADVSQEAISTLDETLRGQIREADRLLENRLGTLDTILSKNATDFTYSLRRVVLFAAIIAALVLLGWQIFKAVWEKKQPLSALWPRIAWGLVGLFLFGIVSYGVTYSNEVVAKKQLLTHYADSYRTSLAELNLDHAVYYSTQLYFLDRKNPEYVSKYQKASLLRDVFYRPALYKTADGARELIFRLGNAQRASFEATKAFDPDLTILYGFVSWQRGSDRFAEYLAASIFASAIESTRIKTPAEFVTLLPFAFYYLNAYLTNPLPDEVVLRLYENGKEPTDTLFDKIAATDQDRPNERHFARRFKLDELRSVSNNTRIDISALARRFPVYSYVQISLEAVKTNRAVVTRYAELLRLTGEISVAADGAKPAIRERIRNVAKELLANWTSYVAFLRENDFDDNSAKLNPMSGLWPIYTRAAAASVLADNADVWGAGDEATGIHNRWLADVVRPSVRATAYRVAEITTKSDFVLNDPKLDALEKLMRAFFDARKKLEAARSSGDVAAQNAASGPVVTTARQIAASAAELGIFGCRNKNVPTFDCREPDALPHPFGQLIFDSALGVSPRLVDDQLVLDKVVRHRTLPAV